MLQEQPPRTTPVEGVPYHLLQRTSRHRWWRTLLGFGLFPVLAGVAVLVLVGVFIGSGALAGVGMDEEGLTDPTWEYAAAMLSVAVLLPVVLLVVRWTQRRPVGTLSSVDGRLRWRWMWRCAGWALLGFAVVLVVSLAQGGAPDLSGWPGWPHYLLIALITLVAVPFQAAAEEYLCRGFLLQGFASWLRTPWPGAVLAALLFVVLHEYDDPLVVADLFVTAMAMSWLTIRTGGLEAAIALHVVNNISAALLDSMQGVPGLEQAGDFSAWEVLPITLLTVLYSWWIDRLFRRSGLSRTAVATS
ncbi:CPBP family intramembrane metalloprotease [Saccharopolyspora sp. NFXS83]|uniref:CPBP family intramembrane glutamic endopeptidase n=1 Tax=Saccharopolyspora sp. NFXS83 TaxID=2993560 RepID=UPI00224B4DF1|nr:CPBP family intramembrane glutamic endopeptidase [Saccharopolyspora sp. NFXS83]MCX2731995.1 CPBP family intramembrane metalloprotease [Saccharopolyspora sp. NFXS83]